MGRPVADDDYGDDSKLALVATIPSHDQPFILEKDGVPGTFLEAAFVDQAYPWPPMEGQGKNAIELQASSSLLEEKAAEEKVVRVKNQSRTTTVTTTKKKRWWNCCGRGVEDQVVTREVHDGESVDLESSRGTPAAAERAEKEKEKAVEKARRRQERYGRVPEGILIYRLNTTTQRLTLLSQPHQKTDRETLVTDMNIVKAFPSNDKSRRGINLVGQDGRRATLIACEQRTAISWLESIEMMLAHRKRKLSPRDDVQESAKISEVLDKKENDRTEDEYLNLAKYSNNLIRAGKVPGTKRGAGGAGGIYYSIDIQPDAKDPEEQEALESIAKRRAVIIDSWDFYRMICSLLRDKHKYDEIFRRMQLDPVYPYLNSMTGLNDPGDSGGENFEKVVMQKDIPDYDNMTRDGVVEHLRKKAEEAIPSLVEICKALAGSLGMEEVGVGPVKEAASAIKKADRKYGGDLLKVTDYCRALLVVKDFPTLLALLELARDSFGPLIRRVKMSSLKSDHKCKPGGYRDCIINVELKGHVCEIQVHLWPMWGVCGVDGFRHYRHCLEYKTDSFENPFDSLDGLSRKTRAELIVMAEEAVVETPLQDLEWYHEKHILDYFAEVGLFLKHGLNEWAETTLKHLIRLRVESPDIGPGHHETIVLYKHLSTALHAQGKNEEAMEAFEKVQEHDQRNVDESEEAEKSLWESLLAAQSEAYDMIIDPNRKEREEEENMRKEVKASKKAWRRIRQERFQFLDAHVAEGGDEKKTPDLDVRTT